MLLDIENQYCPEPKFAKIIRGDAAAGAAPGFVDVRKGFVDKRKRSRSRSPPPESSPQSRKRARGAAASPESSQNQGAAAFDACARAARPVLQQLAGMPDDRARLAQALLDVIPE